MPFIPHTAEDEKAMLSAIGANSIDDLFAEIPADLRCGELTYVPPALSEMEITRLMQQRAAEDSGLLCFAGAGAYEHHIPAAVWEVTTRGEFYSAYTPYQAEASQGTLQLIYEYQTMMTGLTGLDASNASLYDGASALGEAILMAVRAHRKSKSKRILLPTSVNPTYRQVAKAVVGVQGITLETVPCCTQAGAVNLGALSEYEGQDITALVIQQPNFFGNLEDVNALTNWAKANNIFVIAVVNPMTLGVLTPPGEWGDDTGNQGAEIACGEGQPMGIPLSSGGPYFGFMCCKQAHVRQMPGRIVGRTVDLEGKTGYALTLQAREQHIRRSKATSNICTNQGLMVTAATIYMAIQGADGISKIGSHSYANTQALTDKLTQINGVEKVFANGSFNETVLRLPKPVSEVLEALSERGILGGVDISADYPELGNALLVCATETRTEADIAEYATQLQQILEA